MMDWKEMLSSKIASGELPEREDSTIPVAGTSEDKKQTEILSVNVDRKGRKGKTATIVEGFACDDVRLKDIAASLKTKLGTGGSARGGEILIQGERVEDVKKVLREMGFRVK